MSDLIPVEVVEKPYFDSTTGNQTAIVKRTSVLYDPASGKLHEVDWETYDTVGPAKEANGASDDSTPSS